MANSYWSNYQTLQILLPKTQETFQLKGTIIHVIYGHVTMKRSDASSSNLDHSFVRLPIDLSKTNLSSVRIAFSRTIITNFLLIKTLRSQEASIFLNCWTFEFFLESILERIERVRCKKIVPYLCYVPQSDSTKRNLLYAFWKEQVNLH